MPLVKSPERVLVDALRKDIEATPAPERPKPPTQDALVDALREALRPFAEFAAQYPGHDDMALLLASYPRSGERKMITVGDFRRAAAALKEFET